MRENLDAPATVAEEGFLSSQETWCINTRTKRQCFSDVCQQASC